MAETAFAREGRCPRCGGEDIEREVVFQTTMRVPSGVVFLCETCGLTTKAVSSDREAWFDAHKSWASPAVNVDTYEEFQRQWPKSVGRQPYGDPEPLGPILPRATR